MDKSLYKKILFADDDEAFRFTVQEYFSDSPWIFDMAENGVVALDKALEVKYDLIILDINMPFMKGNETVREIKKKWPEVKVLAFTGFAAHDVVGNEGEQVDGAEQKKSFVADAVLDGLL